MKIFGIFAGVSVAQVDCGRDGEVCKEKVQSGYLLCVENCNSNTECISSCNREYDQLLNQCPCESLCPSGCPCPVYAKGSLTD